MALKPGDTLLKGQYRIVRLIGQGGFGFVYHARDTLLGRDVAIKDLVPSAVSDPKWVKRFLVEARATIELHDDHIVATHTLFSESGNHYLVMEYMPGGSLEDALQKTYRLPVNDALRIARQVCEGLSYAHRRGIVHCDLKPANILFAADGTAKVADFGIAHVSSHGAGSRHWATTAPFLAGTLQYMSPEQAQGDRSDPRTDLYALGALLYHVLTGRPYADFRDNATPADIGHNLDLIRNHQPPPPSTHNPSIPPWLDDLVLRLLAKRPEDRPGTAAEVLALLSPPAPVVQGPGTLPQPPAGPPPAPRRRRLPRWVRFESVALLVVILGIALAALIGGRDGGDPTPTPTMAVPSATFTPTARPSGRPTLVPTSTSSPTLTPKPTATPEPTRTPTPVPMPTPTPTRTPLPPGSRFAFASGGVDNRQICIWTAGGSGSECLTKVGTFSESPAWSPDGNLIAFHSTIDGDFDVYVIRADGTELTNLTEDTDKENPPNDGSPSWSPDGTRIAFDTNRHGNSEIYVMNADGSEPTRLTDNSAGDWQPVWSPDGGQIAFVSDRDGTRDIWVMNADGSNPTRLTNDPEDDPAIDEGPAWSPDGTLIAFYSSRDGLPDIDTTEVYVVNADGSSVRRLTENRWDDGSPCWSPDGTRIAFDTKREGNWQVYVMNADGSDPYNLPGISYGEEHFPAWWQE